MATYTDGQPTENAEWFCKWLEEASTDFRYGKTYLKGLRYAVFGLGNSVYVGHYNTVRNGFRVKFKIMSIILLSYASKATSLTAVVLLNHVFPFIPSQVGKNVDKWLWMLSGMRIITRGEGDCNVVKSRNGSVQADFLAWKVRFLSRLRTLAKGEEKSCSGNCKGGGSCKSKKKDGRLVEEEEERAAPQNDSSEVKEGKLNFCPYWVLYGEL